MNSLKVFVDRRQGDERRLDSDPCRNMSIDIYHRKRRKSADRRHPERTLVDDYQAYLGNLKDRATH